LRIRRGTLKQKPQQCEVVACVVWLGFSMDSGSILFAAVFALASASESASATASATASLSTCCLL